MATYIHPLINLFAHDVEGVARFYREHLGFVETFRTPVNGVPLHIAVRKDGLLLGFSDIPTAERLYGVTVGGGSPRMEIAVWTADVDAAWAELMASGCDAVTPPHEHSPGRLRAALLADPAGNYVKIIQDISGT
ncbi:MAG TPA: VOC family protein [Thermomicrobiales bacterium]|jgi:lactoylglutathione lyase|nr:VOC family protein [Thermomicrobiales bacterium]